MSGTLQPSPGLRGGIAPARSVQRLLRETRGAAMTFASPAGPC